MTDFRELCAELVDCLEKANWPLRHKTVFGICLDNARAALAQPEPQGVTDEELKATMLQAIKDFPPSHPDAKPLSEFKYELELEYRKARAVLARWGRPATTGEQQ